MRRSHVMIVGAGILICVLSFAIFFNFAKTPRNSGVEDLPLSPNRSASAAGDVPESQLSPPRYGDLVEDAFEPVLTVEAVLLKVGAKPSPADDPFLAKQHEMETLASRIRTGQIAIVGGQESKMLEVISNEQERLARIIRSRDMFRDMEQQRRSTNAP